MLGTHFDGAHPIAAFAVIRRDERGQTLWLAQWNPKWGAYHFVSGHKRPEEKFRECLVREIGEELHLCEGLDYRIASTAPTHLEFMDFSRLLAELHRDSLYPIMGKDAWVAGADRREAPEPKPVRLGRRLRLRRQPPGSCSSGMVEFSEESHFF